MKVCAYCGKKNPETKDHVPPKGIFAPPRPNFLVTVPCCNDCHSDTAKDDEYFRNMLAMRKDTFRHPDVQGILPKIFRSFSKPEQKKLTKSLIKSIKKTELKTSEGIYLGSVVTYDADLSRLDKVVQRIAKGLYYHENNVIFPINGKVKSYTLHDLNIFKKDKIERIIEVLSNAQVKEIGKKTLVYRMAKGEFEHLGLWLLTFFENVDFLVFMIPPTKKENTV
ncbi:MAG: HNH endonuclease [Flammeovirgaceae bacterium]|nr:HNH endonuclease [Flammeovirgaceae bacterium]